jgi:hypothetical protein
MELLYEGCMGERVIIRSFLPGSAIEPDLLMMATGYRQEFPFLPGHTTAPRDLQHHHTASVQLC